MNHNTCYEIIFPIHVYMQRETSQLILGYSEQTELCTRTGMHRIYLQVQLCAALCTAYNAI